MTNKKTADVIIVGAGISGLILAKLLSEQGIKTLIFERGSTLGLKGFYSGIIPSEDLNYIFPDLFVKDLEKIERNISEIRGYVLMDETFVSINHKLILKEEGGRKNYFSVLQKPFLNYILENSNRSYISLKLSSTVEKLIIQDGNVSGVIVNGEEYFSDVVVIAEGVNSILPKQFGLRKGEYLPEQLLIFFEENINIEPEIIEKKLNIQDGVSIKFFTEFKNCSEMNGIGYLNTNKNSVSIGVGVLLSDSINLGVNINQYFEKFKNHPVIKEIISEGKTINSLSYVLPAHTRVKKAIPLPRLYESGCLLIGGAAGLINPFSWSLSELPIFSAQSASSVILQAKSLNDFSSNVLSEYKILLESSPLFKELFVNSLVDNSLQASGKISSKAENILLNDLTSYILKGTI